MNIRTAMDAIVFVAAHPDDVANGMGGTAWLLKDAFELHVLCATRGEIGVRGQNEAETAAIREKEEQAACALLNAGLTFLDRTDGKLFADRDICQKVADIIEKMQPRAVITIWPVDRHPDHSAISEITRKAIRLAGVDSELYFCEEGKGCQTIHFHPDIYVDITPVIDHKLRLIRCHVCQNTDDRMVHRFYEQARERGKEAGCEYAEGFKTMNSKIAKGTGILDGLAAKSKTPSIGVFE